MEKGTRRSWNEAVIFLHTTGNRKILRYDIELVKRRQDGFIRQLELGVRCVQAHNCAHTQVSLWGCWSPGSSLSSGLGEGSLGGLSGAQGCW